MLLLLRTVKIIRKFYANTFLLPSSYADHCVLHCSFPNTTQPEVLLFAPTLVKQGKEQKRNSGVRYCICLNRRTTTRRPLFRYSLRTFAVFRGIDLVFLAGNSKHTAGLKFIGQRNNVKIKESNLSLVPRLGWILFEPSLLVSIVAFKEKLSIDIERRKRCRQTDRRDVRPTVPEKDCRQVQTLQPKRTHSTFDTHASVAWCVRRLTLESNVPEQWWPFDSRLQWIPLLYLY